MGYDRKDSDMTASTKSKTASKNLTIIKEFEAISHEIDDAITRADFAAIELLDQSRRNLISKMEVPKDAFADEQWFKIARRCVEQNDAAKERVLGLMAELRHNTGSKLRQLSGYRPS